MRNLFRALSKSKALVIILLEIYEGGISIPFYQAGGRVLDCMAITISHMKLGDYESVDDFSAFKKQKMHQTDVRRHMFGPERSSYKTKIEYKKNGTGILFLKLIGIAFN